MRDDSFEVAVEQVPQAGPIAGGLGLCFDLGKRQQQQAADRPPE
jgi:hypothetical protein